MTKANLTRAAGSALAAVLTLVAPVSAADGPGGASDAPNPPASSRSAGPPAGAAALAGTWLAEDAWQGKANAVSRVWTSCLTVAGDSFKLTKFMGVSKNLKGTFTLGTAGDPKAVDLTLEPLDLSEAGAPVKIPACTLPGIWKLEGDRLTVCFVRQAGGQRPAAFDATGQDVDRLVFVRAPAGFKRFPDKVTVRVVTADGKPAAGVTVACHMYPQDDPGRKGADRSWTYYKSVRTGEDGTAKVKVENLANLPLLARDPGNRRMAVAAVSPPALLGEIVLTLRPECRVTGAFVCEYLKTAAKAIGWANVYMMIDGQRVSMCNSEDGRFELPAPPGSYTLHCYGTDLRSRYVTIHVPEGKSEFSTGPIELTASRLLSLQGRPAPELDGVLGWKGGPVRLADLHGRYVLLEFWGYWCGPCVGAMPVLIELHERFADKGLSVIGVHVDGDDGVDTAAKLDEKIAGYKKRLWHGKDIPFPVALTSGKEVGAGETRSRGLAAEQYGVLSYPTTVLIGRDGNVVGRFHARNAKAAADEVEKLLSAKK